MKKNCLIKKTRSLCPSCLEEISAEIFEDGGRAIMRKTCRKHGEFRAVVENEADFYKKILERKPDHEPKRNNLVIPITYKCNLKCRYCYLPSTKIKDFSDDEILSYINSPRHGHVLFSGGEPTLHPHLLEFISYTKNRGKMACIITNGTKLSSGPYVRKLRRAGLDYIVFPLYSLDDNISEQIENKRLLKTKLKAFENIKKEKISTILSFSWLKGMNDRDFKKIFNMALKNKNVFEFRCRIFSMIGRHEQTENNTLSDFIQLLAEATDIPPSEYLEYWFGQRKRDSFSWYPSQYLFRIEYYGFVLNTKTARKLKSSMITYPLYIFYLMKRFGFLNFMRFVHRRASKKQPTLFINMFNWPDKYDVDLNELRFFEHDHVALDGSINPFFETMMLNEKIRKRLSKR